MELHLILRIWPSCCKLSGNGVFRNGGNGGDNAEPSLFCSVFQLYKSVLICPVSLDAEKDSFCSIPMDCGQPFGCSLRHPPAIGRNGNHRNIIFLQSDIGKSRFAIWQVNKLDSSSNPFVSISAVFFVPPVGLKQIS